jgi:hypothetical protein
MSSYTKTTNFTAKDNLTSGDPAKVIKGAEFDTEFNSIETAVNSKANSNNTVLTGTADVANVDAESLDTQSLSIGGVEVTATPAELNTLDGITSTTAELNILDGVTATASELNITDGLTASTSELNILDGATLSTAELNLLDGVTATTTEINKLDGFTGTVDDLNYAKDLRATGVTTAEFDKLDGLTATTTELNYVDGVTSNIQTQLDSKADDTTSPTLTLDGDVSGSATLTNLGDATLTVTVADDSHNHTIANVDGLQTALDGKATSAQGALADSAVQPNDDVSFGTVQADGLTVDGSSPKITITDTDTGADHEISGSSAAASLFIESDKNSNNLGGAMQFKTQGVKRFDVENSTGDVQFYEDTGTTAKFQWDSSEEQLSLTGSVSGKVPFRTYSGGYSADYNSYSAEEGFQVMSYQTDGGSPYTKTSDLVANADGTAPSEMRLLTKANGSSSPTEAMRIDSSGNLLVGTTDAFAGITGSTTQGVSLSGQYNAIYASRSGGESLTLNRQSNDGDIAQFRKDGAIVGSIGANAGAHLTVGSGDAGLLFNASTNKIHPWNMTTQGVQDGTVDLGVDVSRFKDLYLSGGMYLGGTGSANKLDDYEEGTWTPTLSSGGGCFSSITSITKIIATYTKIGNTVHLIGSIDTAGTFTNAEGDLKITGLPFQASFGSATGDNADLFSLGCAQLYSGHGTFDSDMMNVGINNGIEIVFYRGTTNGTTDGEIHFQMTYTTSL